MTTWLRWARISLACYMRLCQMCDGEWWEPYPNRPDDSGPCQCPHHREER